MPKSRVRWILLTLLLVAISAAACGGTVYNWQDAAGYVHYADTPPAGGTLLNGPVSTKTARAGQDKPMMQEWCGMDMCPANCETARNALQQDYEDLARSAQEPEPVQISKAESERLQAAIRASACPEYRNILA